MTETRVLAPPGTVLGGRYTLGPVLGVGGMATVHLAHDDRLSRDVAIKLFRPDVADAQDLRRVRSETRMLAALSHGSLVTLHDASTGDAGEPAYLVLELVDGPNLAELLAEDELPAGELAALLAQVADALAYIAARGIVHRDIKPENILVARDGEGGLRAKLADLGIARIVDESRLTQVGGIIGTAAYLSPEQVTDDEVGPASDVYSLGLVLLEGLTGERPFRGTGTASMAARTLRAPRLPAGLERADEDLVAAMTALDPEDRPSAREVRDRLRRWTSEAIAGALPAAPPPPDPRTRVLPPALAAPTAATRVFTAPREDPTVLLPGTVPPSPAAAPAVSAPPSPARRRRHAAAWITALVLVFGAGGAGVLAAWPTIEAWVTPGPAEPPPVYPAVEGDLGVHLAELAAAIEGEGLTDELTVQMRGDVLATATAAAVTDYAGAVTSLEATAADLDAAALDDRVTSAKYRVLLTAIEVIRADLDSAIADEQAELARVQAEKERIEQERLEADQWGVFEGLRERLDELGRDVERQIDDWAAGSSA
ncbi:MAG: putative serine/threonine-protein kinase [Naasia sp.]|nr:putative serine/threonine-protein kinase [Naasia sp.]